MRKAARGVARIVTNWRRLWFRFAPNGARDIKCSREMKNEVSITTEIIVRHGITDEEFERIKKILGRVPNITELGIFSVMWSEHCSYKNSRPLLRGFPTEKRGATASFGRVLVKAGEENA